MKTRYALRLLAALIALSFGISCSPPEDPGDDNGGGNGDEADAMDQIDDTGEDEDDDDPDTGDDDEMDAGDDNDDPDTGGDDPDATGDTGDDGGIDFDPSTCEVQSDFNGQIGNTDVTKGGGTPASSTDALPEDTGLQAVYDYMEANAEDARSEDGLSLSEEDQIEVTGAIVTATEGGENLPFFYLQDQQRALYARLSEGHDSVDVTVGDEVSFTVTGVSIFSGQPQIQDITGFSVDSEDNDVPIQNVGQSTPSLDRYQQIVRVGGALTEGRQCGGDCSLPAGDRDGQCWQCYDMLDQEGETIIEFRSNSLTQDEPLGYYAGTCMTFVGPLGQFPGPLAENADDPTVQVQETNWDWGQSASQ